MPIFIGPSETVRRHVSGITTSRKTTPTQDIVVIVRDFCLAGRREGFDEDDKGREQEDERALDEHSASWEDSARQFTRAIYLNR